MKQSRRSFFSTLTGALLVAVPASLLGPARAKDRLALVCHRLAWEDGLTGRPAKGQFKSIAAARKAGFPEDHIIVPPSHIEPAENKDG
jgi:hypothetical protein